MDVEDYLLLGLGGVVAFLIYRAKKSTDWSFSTMRENLESSSGEGYTVTQSVYNPESFLITAGNVSYKFSPADVEKLSFMQKAVLNRVQRDSMFIPNFIEENLKARWLKEAFT